MVPDTKPQRPELLTTATERAQLRKDLELYDAGFQLWIDVRVSKLRALLDDLDALVGAA